MSRQAATSKNGVKPPHSKGLEPAPSIQLLGETSGFTKHGKRASFDAVGQMGKQATIDTYCRWEGQ